MSKISLDEDTKFFIGLKDDDGNVDKQNLQEIKPTIIDNNCPQKIDISSALNPVVEIELTDTWKAIADIVAVQLHVSFVSRYWKDAIETYKLNPNWWQAEKLDMGNIKINWHK